MQSTIILGNGGHAKVIIEIFREVGLYEPVGCVSPTAPANNHVHGVPYVGTDADLPEIFRSGVRSAFIALGNNQLRQMLLKQVSDIGFHVATAVSRTSCVSPSARLGCGIAVMPGAIVGPDTTVGVGSILNTNASVDHDGTLGECCHIGPGATLAGNVSVGNLAFIATGSSVIPETQVGSNSIVGAGSVVVRDVPADVVAYGVPAEVRRAIEAPPNIQAPTPNHSLRLVS